MTGYHPGKGMSGEFQDILHVHVAHLVGTSRWNNEPEQPGAAAGRAEWILGAARGHGAHREDENKPHTVQDQCL